MTLYYYDPVFMEHQTGDHPERSDRVLAVVRHLNFIALDSSCIRPSWLPATVQRLRYVHTDDYIDSVKRFADAGGGYLDADTFVSRKSFEVASVATGAVCDAVTRVVAGEDRNAFCLVRPPGHHAMPDHAMGFCLFNHVAVGARVATRELGLRSVLIVDFDVHHGNGTQAIFWEDPAVGYFSMHRWPLYPGTGADAETGGGAGLGTTLNIPITFGTSAWQQLSIFEDRLGDFADRLRPELVLVSAGFDSHKDDPIGSLGLETEDFRPLTRILLEVAERHSQGRLVSVLEGGYNSEALTESVTVHLEELVAAPGQGSAPR